LFEILQPGPNRGGCFCRARNHRHSRKLVSFVKGTLHRIGHWFGH